MKQVDRKVQSANDWNDLSAICEQADAYYAQNKMSGDEVIRIGEICMAKAKELVAEGETTRQAERDSYSRENGIEL
jgi:hypothetical protein